MDRSFVERNAKELARLRAIVERATDDDLRVHVNPECTVAGVLAHVAFWDARALLLGRKLQRGEAFSPAEAEPEDVSWINDSTRPLIEAIPPREAARLALRIAEETDAVMAALTPEQVAHTWPTDPKSLVNPLRAAHRGEHVDDIEAALARGQSARG